MRREELAMSMVLGPTPAQNWRRPPPEPPEPTTGVLNSGKALPNASATIEAKGSTVDEPAIWIVSGDWAIEAPDWIARASVAADAVRKNLFIGACSCSEENPSTRLASGAAITASCNSWMTVACRFFPEMMSARPDTDHAGKRKPAGGGGPAGHSLGAAMGGGSRARCRLSGGGKSPTPDT